MTNSDVIVREIDRLELFNIDIILLGNYPIELNYHIVKHGSID